MWFFHNPGLLGINARNLLYIKPYNPKKAVILADSKIKTKNFLSARGIPVTKLYASITNKKELKTFDFNVLPNSFVLKPNAGFGGEGIIIIKSTKGDKFIKDNGTTLTKENLTAHINDILDGRYSIADIADIAFFEQRLEAPDLLKKMSYKGLPDIRIVVHNLIPVMAMLRLPTEESQGKANIHMGGIGVGIDIAKGELTFATQHGKKIESIPGFGPVKGVKIPHWKELLLNASKVQQVTNLGFAAIDMVLDKNMGPVLLEINARAGLQLQVANMAPLRKRLERIEGIKVNTPEKGVRIAQDIFGQKIEIKEDRFKGKAIIGVMERIEIIGKKEIVKIVARVEPMIEKSVLDEAVAERIGLESDRKCKFNLMEKKVMTVVDVQNLSGRGYQMLIGHRDLQNFLIDPTLSSPQNTQKSLDSTPLLKRTFDEKELKKIDLELFDIDSQIKLLNHLRPINLKEENTKFLLDPFYNPQFKYKKLSFDSNHLHARLKRIEFPETSMGTLWRKKADEIRRKIDLLEARGKPEFNEKSAALYPMPTDEILQTALEQIKAMPKEFPHPGRVYSSKEAKKEFEKVFHAYGLKGWQVKLKDDMVADAVAGKENTVTIRTGATFNKDRLVGTIAHEIETHAFTAINGSLQPYRIFQRGLADYLMTEEGLAVYNQDLTESKDAIKKYWPASSVVGIRTGATGSFVDIYLAVLDLGFGAQRAWMVALKAKRGLTDTSQPGVFTKDAVYFSGHKMIQEFVANGGDLKDLYYGKTNLLDLELIKKVKGLKAPTYLPSYLRDELK